MDTPIGTQARDCKSEKYNRPECGLYATFRPIIFVLFFHEALIINTYQGFLLAQASSRTIASYKTPAEPLNWPEPEGFPSGVYHS